MKFARLATVAVAIALVVASACSPGAPSTAGTRSGVARVELTFTLDGPGGTWSDSGLIDSGSMSMTYASNSTVSSAKGSLTLGSATVSWNLTAALGTNYGGWSRVTIPGEVDRVVSVDVRPVTFDNDGDLAASAAADGWTLTWSTAAIDAPGVEPAYDALTATEATYCQDAQQRLAGLDEAEVPQVSIGNTIHTTRAAFAASKATLSPLAVQTWTEARTVTTASGNGVTLGALISCKGRNGDHVATTGVSTLADDLQCSALTQRSLDLAWAELAPAERSAFDATGVDLVPGPDVIRGTGAEWTTPIADSSVSGSTVTITGHALQTKWNDPAFAIFPDNIRGVHYCTVWSPAYAYWWYTVGAFTL